MPEQEEEFLQVYMVEPVIERFKQWVNEQGWELSPIPRFGESDETYVKTHIIVPKNLDQLLRRAAEFHRSGRRDADNYGLGQDELE